MSALDDFRNAKDAFFGNDSHSPLTEEQRQDFHSLRYYPEDRTLALRTLLDTNVVHEELDMDTNTGDKQSYTRAGKVTFTVDGVEATIFLYAAEHMHEFFIPFRDATSGTETYGAGRYLEAEVEDDGAVVVDFNYAYNPYCAYNEQWSCPIPPIENWLPVPICAGEKAYDSAH